LILSKIIKITATSCQILRLKCTKFDFTPDPAGGAYSASPDSLAGLSGPPRNVALMILTPSQKIVLRSYSHISVDSFTRITDVLSWCHWCCPCHPRCRRWNRLPFDR